MSKNNGHLLSIDLIRIISAIGVGVIHIVAISYFLIDKIGYKNWLISSSMGWLLIWATPMFIMVSGYLLIDKRKIDEPKSFWIKRIKRIFIPFLFWNLFYYLLNKNFLYFNMADFLKSVENSRVYSHLYFLNIMVGLYLVTPLITKYISKIKTGLVLFLFLLASIYHFAYCFLNFPKIDNLAWLTFLPYLGYYLGGYLIREKIKLKRYKALMFLSTVFLFLSVWITRKLVFIFETHNQDTILVSNLSIPIAIFTFLLFFGLVKIKNENLKKYSLIKLLSPLTFGVYLIHPFWIKIIQSSNLFNSLYDFNYFLWFFLLVIVILATSFTSIFLINKIPIIKKVVGS